MSDRLIAEYQRRWLVDHEKRAQVKNRQHLARMRQAGELYKRGRRDAAC